MQAEKTEQDLDDAVGGLTFGLPAVVAGSRLVWELRRQKRQETRDRLQSNFFRLIEEGNGRITVLRFAKDTQLSGEEARRFHS